MNYELAKELKNAGFPQGIYDSTEDGSHYMFREVDDKFGNNRTMFVRQYLNDFIEKRLEDIVLVPTLSELIKACGSESFELADIDTTHPKSEFGWRAKKGNHASLGQTPEEAVAMLWLELRK